jgi:hypothetical protein
MRRATARRRDRVGDGRREGDRLARAELDLEAVRAGARQLIAEQRGARREAAEMDQQQAGRERDREQLDPERR